MLAWRLQRRVAGRPEARHADAVENEVAVAAVRDLLRRVRRNRDRVAGTDRPRCRVPHAHESPAAIYDVHLEDVEAVKFSGDARLDTGACHGYIG